jgi:hypothetical protein
VLQLHALFNGVNEAPKARWWDIAASATIAPTRSEFLEA